MKKYEMKERIEKKRKATRSKEEKKEVGKEGRKKRIEIE